MTNREPETWHDQRPSHVRVDLADYDTPVYPARIRAAAAEAHARRATWKEAVERGNVTNLRPCDYYEFIAGLVNDASDAETALAELIAAWQDAALTENTSLLQWLDQASGERDYEER